MNTLDPDAGASRGWVLIEKPAGAPGRVEVPSLSHKMVRLAAAAVLIVFSLGAAAGALFMRWRLRRRQSDM